MQAALAQKNRVMWRDIQRVIEQHDNFLLTTHINPDGDGIGSAAAMTELINAFGKKARFVSGSPIPSKFDFLDFHSNHELFDEGGDYSGTQAVIILDAHKADRLGPAAALLDLKGIVTVCIDHHQAEDSFCDFSFINSEACSVGAMVYRLFKEMGVALNLNAAKGIYTAVVCDTGRFSYSSTNRRAHKIADECIKLGVDPDEMYSRLFQHMTLDQAKMFAQAVTRMETFLDNRIVVEQLSCDDYEAGSEDNPIDMDYIHEFNKHIENVECVALLRELDDGSVRVSLRSLGELDVCGVVQTLGGGGHCKAAGAICQGSLDHVKVQVVKAIESQMVGF